MLACSGGHGDFPQPLLTIGYLRTLIQKRTPQARDGSRLDRGRGGHVGAGSGLAWLSAAALVSLLDYRVIFLVIGAVVALGAVWIAVRLRDELGPGQTRA